MAENDSVFEDNSINFGKILADSSPGEEVVISGISGRYPESENVEEFQDNLFSKVDMISSDDRRWKPGHPEIPQRTGKVPSIVDFDAGFFGYTARQATQLDPELRMFLEVTMEAIFDAGLHPSELEGTKTGVFIGACFNETENMWFTQKLVPQGYAVLGNTRSMLANHTSKFLKLKGPSVVCDTACSSSSYALENAYKAIRMGACDMAIVGGTNLVLHPLLTLQFARLGVLSPDGACKAFDESGNGYVRSETICAVLLQKSKDAKRIYSTVMHAKTNSDGYKNSGITFPSRDRQRELFDDFYQECSTIKPSHLSFMDAHGTGTVVGDPEELAAIEEVFTKERDGTLLIGSVKSNIGHTEPSAGLCAVTKAIIAHETGYIPPNIHYKVGRKEVAALNNGKFTVVTEKTPFIDNWGLIGINSFGFGGANAHIVLKKNTKEKAQNEAENVPRIICVSGRSLEAIDTILNNVLKNNFDVEQIGLLHEVFKKNITGHLYRGYSLALKSGEIKRSSNICKNLKPDYLLLSFGDIDEQSIKNAKELLSIPIALSVIQRIHDVLGPKGINILSVLKSGKKVSRLESEMATFAIQILLGDIVKVCRIRPDKVTTLSKNLCRNGIVCAYFENVLTLQEVTEYTYHLVVGNIENSHNNSNNFQQQLRYIYESVKSDILKENSFNTLSQFLTNLAKTALTSPNEKRWTLFEIGNGAAEMTLTNDKIKPEIIKCDGEINSVLSSIGRLYEIGFNPQIQNLYPKIEFPVSRGTPMISPSIKWNHSRKYFAPDYSRETIVDKEAIHLSIVIDKPEYSFMTGHVIDGRNLLPATGYLYFVWELFADLHNLLVDDLKIVFENCKFERATTLPKDDAKLELDVMIQKQSGHFEVVEGGVRVVSGKIRFSVDDGDLLEEGLPTDFSESSLDMNNKDIYKELRLRGYYYSGQFKAIHSASSNGGKSYIKWENNWVTFMDNMLQVKILQEDTRQLYVPTSIRRIVIDAKKHAAYAEQKPILPVTLSKETGIIRSGYIQIIGLNASWIARRKDLGVAVVEKQVFVPNQASLTTENALRVNMQILLENLMSYKVKVVELIEEASESEPLGEIIGDVLGDQPLIMPEISSLNLKNVENNVVPTDSKCSLVVGTNMLQRSQILDLAFGFTGEDGFVLSRESLDFEMDTSENKDLINIISIFTNENEKLVFFKKTKNTSYNYSLIKISVEDKEFDWISQLQNEIKKEKQIIVYAQDEPLNGILGLVTCVRREVGGQKISLFYTDAAPDFDIDNSFYADQLSKGLAVNVFKFGKWGTYRHLLLSEANLVKAEHCYANSLRKGDLSSLAWMEGPLKSKQEPNNTKEIVEIHCSSINFRDVMVASGKINADSFIKNRKEHECVQGIEFAGFTKNGRKVMGITNSGALANIVEAESSLLWDVPEKWSLEEAVTVPVVYATTIVGLINRGNLRSGESVLIHSGAGGVGLSAIQIALFMGCTVYTTVGTAEKREFLKQWFPQLKDHHIFNSRTIAFEKDVMNATKGRGVDLVLNSLAEEKLIASVRCLAQGGRFIEIGKFDLANDNILKLLLLEKEVSFHGVMVDRSMSESDETRLELHQLVKEYLEKGAIRPLPRTTFKKNELEAAFRYMTTGKHIGKVVIQPRNTSENSSTEFSCLPRYNCENDKTYIICGGLGGFGLELADWLILRGCKNLVLTSRNGIKTGYQAYRISIWKSYGCNIEISTDDITTYEGCLNLIETSNKLGPVHAIFNLAVVLNDAIFENQTKETFKRSFGPKAIATEFLDVITRKMCPQLRDFVVFSSVSCGRGNAGQTNYGMSNAVMERICEKRKCEGLPALAIQWGAIGEVGLVADMQEEAIEIEIGGTLQQRISNCLGIMDQLLKQNESAVVSSIVVAEKKSSTGGDNMVDAVANILGIKDIKSIPLQATLAEIGMDSMTGVEVKQTLDREFEVFLSAQDIKVLTFAKLLELQAERSSENKDVFATFKGEEASDAIMQLIPNEENATEIILPINGKSNEGNSYDSTVILFPGIDGSIKILEPLYKNIEANLVGLQYPHSEQKDSHEEMGKLFLPILEKQLSKETPFQIVSYSYGSTIALETVKLLEQKGYYGTLICIDGAPNYIKALLNVIRRESAEESEIALLVQLATFVYPLSVITPHLPSLYKCPTFEEKVDVLYSALQPNLVYSVDHLKNCAVDIYKRINSLSAWTPKFKLKSKILLFKPTLNSANIPDEISSLSELSEKPVDVETLNGNHVTILENKELADAINIVLNLKQ